MLLFSLFPLYLFCHSSFAHFVFHSHSHTFTLTLSLSFFFRIRYCTQEIVILREDLVSKMRRHCILPPSDSTQLISVHVRTNVFLMHTLLCSIVYMLFSYGLYTFLTFSPSRSPFLSCIISLSHPFYLHLLHTLILSQRLIRALISINSW